MSGKCSSCGLCCKLFLINLNEEEYRSGRYKTVFWDFEVSEDFSKAKKYGANLLAQKKHGSCLYLKSKLCSIHTFRPQVCRNFFCTSKSNKFKEMIKIISSNLPA